MTALDGNTVLLKELASGVEAADGASRLEVTNAMTGRPLGDVPRCASGDVADAAQRARAIQPAWAARPIRERAEVLLRFHDLVLQHQDEVLDLIQLENGKARRHAFEEVLDVCLTARYYANTAADYLRPKRRQGVQLMLTHVTELHHPKGLVGIISPWNYPLTLGISDALPAIVAGNAVLTKPDQQTPFSALWAVRLLEEAGMPPGLVQVVTGFGSELGTPIIEQSDYLMFTGSTPVGRTVAAQAGQRRLLDGVGRQKRVAGPRRRGRRQGGVRRGAGGVLQCRAVVHFGRAHLCSRDPLGRIHYALRGSREGNEPLSSPGLFGRHGIADLRQATQDGHRARRRRGGQGRHRAGGW
jgi:delta 1-pyrroline-5-carboxylate dehydrogenase